MCKRRNKNKKTNYICILKKKKKKGRMKGNKKYWRRGLEQLRDPRFRGHRFILSFSSSLSLSLIGVFLFFYMDMSIYILICYGIHSASQVDLGWIHFSRPQYAPAKVKPQSQFINSIIKKVEKRKFLKILLCKVFMGKKTKFYLLIFFFFHLFIKFIIKNN